MIKANGQKLETVTSFKYLGSIPFDGGSKPEIPSRTAQTTEALTIRLKPAWNDRSISLSSKIRLMHSLVTFIFLYACESWTPNSRAAKQNTSHGNGVLPQYTSHHIQRPCYQRGSLCQDPAGNRTTRRPPDHRKETQTSVVWSCLPFTSSGQTHLVKKKVKGERRQGGQKKRWEDNVREWTNLEFAMYQKQSRTEAKWRKLVVKSSAVPQRPPS